MKGAEVKADFHYYSRVDNFNTLGLGAHVRIANGSGSDSESRPHASPSG